MPWFQAPNGNWWFLSQELLDDDCYSSKLVQGDNMVRKTPNKAAVKHPEAKVKEAEDYGTPMLQAPSASPPPRPYPQPVYVENKTVYSDGRIEESKTTYPYRS